jgi:predicted molibdopterin-dependent oxidoreductase YjgC
MNIRGAAKEDWAILNQLSEELGQPLNYTNADSVVKAIRGTVTASAAPAAATLQRVETPKPSTTDASFPLRLFTGRLMFDRSTIQGRSTVLPGLAPDPFVELNPADAVKLGVADGDGVVVTTAQGELGLVARVTTDVPSGSVFVPSGYNEAPVTALWNEALDVVPCRIIRVTGEAGADQG